MGRTKWWELKKAGVVKTVRVGGTEFAVYAALKALAEPHPPEGSRP